jgi:hypothetical protein
MVWLFDKQCWYIHIVICIMSLCGLANDYQHSGGTQYLQLQGTVKMKSACSSKTVSQPRRSHNTSSFKTSNLMSAILYLQRLCNEVFSLHQCGFSSQHFRDCLHHQRLMWWMLHTYAVFIQKMLSVDLVCSADRTPGTDSLSSIRY